MRIVLLLAHSIEEYDQVALLTALGHDVFSIGAYSEPSHPGDPLRPPLPQAADHPELRAACDEQRARLQRDFGEPGDKVDWAKWLLPPEVRDWADAIVCHHIESRWLKPQWGWIRDKRVVWRTVGQSVENNEREMAPLRADGLQVVRYSSKERHVPGYIGEDALIRFYKDPAEWSGWNGADARVINVTQKLAQRDPWTNHVFWRDATAGLPALAVGEGSEQIGGAGRVGYDAMRQHLRDARAYLYTGTQPASYTLGLLEALMTGIPVVSIGPAHMTAFSYGPDLFEGHELAPYWSDDPAEAHRMLRRLLDDWQMATEVSEEQRERAVAEFGIGPVSRAWAEFLG